ncbi:MAG: glycosyl hydrolase [Spirochaetae bacterium HGW-Spirochaetae-2]|nr:MAG: glycosyl hydrolase [Spirochaetae bacterium HGW-Spirochaetae-2]
MDSTEACSIARCMVDSILTWYSPDKMRWHYEDGLFLFSTFAVGIHDGDDLLLQRVKATYDTLVNPDGTISSYRMDDYNLDQINAGRLLFDLYGRFGDERYQKAVTLLADQLLYQMRTLGGGYWHKRIYPRQIWLDGLYMAQPFRCRFALDRGDATIAADVVRQMVAIESRTRDASTGLLYHAWDESLQQLWANQSTGCSPHFWGRSMGWYCMALVDVLDYLGPDVPGREELVDIVGRTADAVLQWQDRCHLWYQILDQGSRADNYLETSCSAMFSYFLLKAHRLGLLEEDCYRNAGIAAFEALVDRKTSTDANGLLHLHDICSVAGLGGTPYRDGSYGYYVGEPVATDDFKGVGPFILAALEIPD